MTRRRLSDEERVLWDSIAKSAKPLRKRVRKTRIEASIAIVAPAQAAAAPRAPAKSVPVRAAPKGKAELKPSAPPLAPMTRKERSRVAKGRNEIDARLDLHGRTLAQAHGVLLRFLNRAQADGATLVLVITGKGRVSGEGRETGALRREVPHWLTLPELRNVVLGFEAAHVGHGGEGALYVRLRRGR
jgi:DNA-nicking Smr family endonuclease